MTRQSSASASAPPPGLVGGMEDRADLIAMLCARAAMMIEDVAPGLLDADALGDVERAGLIIDDAAAALRRALILVEAARAVRGWSG